MYERPVSTEKPFIVCHDDITLQCGELNPCVSLPPLPDRSGGKASFSLRFRGQDGASPHEELVKKYAEWEERGRNLRNGKRVEFPASGIRDPSSSSPPPKVGGSRDEWGDVTPLTCIRRSKLTALDKPWFPLSNRKKKSKRLFQRLISGIRWHSQEKFSRFITLTSAKDSPPVRESWQKMKQRIQRLTPLRLIQMGYLTSGQLHYFYPKLGLMTPLRFNYLRVETDEGNGVLHIAYFGDYIPQEWLSDTWLKLHGAWNVSISARPNENAKKLAGYILSHEIYGQDGYVGNTSWAHSWVFKGFVGIWHGMVKEKGFEVALPLFEQWLYSHVKPELLWNDSTLDT